MRLLAQRSLNISWTAVNEIVMISIAATCELSQSPSALPKFDHKSRQFIILAPRNH